MVPDSFPHLRTEFVCKNTKYLRYNVFTTLINKIKSWQMINCKPCFIFRRICLLLQKLSYTSHSMQLLHTLQTRKEKHIKRKEKKSR